MMYVGMVIILGGLVASKFTNGATAIPSLLFGGVLLVVGSAVAGGQEPRQNSLTGQTLIVAIQGVVILAVALYVLFRWGI